MSTEQESEPPMPDFPELPDWANVDVLETRRDETYSDWHFARPFAEIERPILTAPQVADKVGASNNTARDRLDRLVNDGFLEMYDLAPSEDRSSKTKIYWLRHPDVRDPIPTELSGEQISDLTRLDELESENEVLREQVDRQEQELQTETERAETYEQKLQQIDSVITGTIFSLFLLLIPIVVVDALQGVPAFFRALAQPSVGFGLMLIVATIALYLINKVIIEALDKRSLRDILGQ
jgi:DNA-binding Lrp family transcriptional regulator